MRRLLCIVLVVLIVTVSVSVQAGAKVINTVYHYGDADMDGTISVLDATHIQRVLAQLNEATDYVTAAGDYDRDGELTVVDATCIQRVLAFLSVSDGCGGDFSDLLDWQEAIASYSSGKAAAGVPVTFTARVVNGGTPLKYKYSIDGTTVQWGTDVTLTYTFEQTGVYDIQLSVDDAFHKDVAVYQTYYEVVDPYPLDVPVIRSHYFDITDTYIKYPVLNASAVGGSGSYRYTFRIDLTGCEQSTPETALWNYELKTDELTGDKYLIQDKENTDKSTIPYDILAKGGYYEIKVHAVDSEGKISVIESIPFNNIFSY